MVVRGGRTKLRERDPSPKVKVDNPAHSPLSLSLTPARPPSLSLFLTPARPPSLSLVLSSPLISDRAYASTAYGPPPTLDNHEGHPFLAAGAGGAGAGGSVQAPPVAAPAQAAAPAAATAPAPPPHPAPRPAPELIDLLGMHEPTPVSAPVSAAAPAAPTPAAWAAFEPAPRPPSLPSTTTAAAPLAAAFADHDWDVFQAAEPALAGAFAATPGRSGSGGGRAAGSDPPPAVAPAPPPPPPAPARPDHTAAIMRMFDAVPGTAAGSPGGAGRRAGPLLPDLSGGSGGRVTPPFGAPFLQAQAPPPSASPTRRGL